MGLNGDDETESLGRNCSQMINPNYSARAVGQWIFKTFRLTNWQMQYLPIQPKTRNGGSTWIERCNAQPPPIRRRSPPQCTISCCFPSIRSCLSACPVYGRLGRFTMLFLTPGPSFLTSNTLVSPPLDEPRISVEMIICTDRSWRMVLLPTSRNARDFNSLQGNFPCKARITSSLTIKSTESDWLVSTRGVLLARFTARPPVIGPKLSWIDATVTLRYVWFHVYLQNLC